MSSEHSWVCDPQITKRKQAPKMTSGLKSGGPSEYLVVFHTGCGTNKGQTLVLFSLTASLAPKENPLMRTVMVPGDQGASARSKLGTNFPTRKCSVTVWEHGGLSRVGSRLGLRAPF